MSTTNDQLAQVPLPTDEVFHNYSASVDIAANVAVALDTTNFIGDALGSTIPGIILPTTGGNPTLCVGITMEKIKAGSNGRVRTNGVAYAIANGTITVGQTVDADVTTAGKILAHTAGKASLGFARSGGAAADPILVFVAPSLNA